MISSNRITCFLVLWIFFGFLNSLAAKENAALMLPKFPKGFSKQDAQILILDLEEELSTRFDLLSREVVKESFRKAIASLPGEECTEDNCILKMQEDLKVSLIFAFGILKSDLVTVMTLRLTEGAKKIVKTEVCTPPCDLKKQLNLQKNLVQSVLFQRDQDRSPSGTGEPGIALSTQSLMLTEGSDAEKIGVRLSGSPSLDVFIKWEVKPKDVLVLEPQILQFDSKNWDQEQSFRVYTKEDFLMGKDSKGSIEIYVSKETKDMNYSFSSFKESVSFTLKDNDRLGILKLRSNPQGARVFVDGKALLNEEGKPVTTNTVIELKPGLRTVSLKKEGFKETTQAIEVKRKRLGTWMMNLPPDLAQITIRVPYRYTDSSIYIDGKPRFLMKGSNKITLGFPAGQYEIQAMTKTQKSSSKSIEVIAGKRQEILFESFSSREGIIDRSVKTLGVTESYLGPQTELLLSRSSIGPLKYVSWHIPGIVWGMRGDRQDIEIFGSQGSGTTETFTASEGGTEYVIKEVTVQKFGMSYVYKNFSPLKLKAGLNQTSLEFNSSSKSFKYSYPAASAGIGLGMNLSQFIMNAAANFSSKGEGSVNAGISYVF